MKRTALSIAFVAVALATATSSRAQTAPDPSAPAASAAASPVASAPEEPQLRGGAALRYLGQHNVFRTSYVGWGTSVDTAFFDKSKGSAFMSWTFAPRVAFVDSPDDWLWLGTSISGDTRIASEYQKSEGPKGGLADLPIDLGYRRTLVRNARGLVLMAGPQLALAFPTSEASRYNGVHARTVVGLDAAANVPLLRGEALNSAFFLAGFSWQHVFSRATTAEPLGATWAPLDRRFRTGDLLVHDQIAWSLSYWVNLYGNLSVGNDWGFGVPFRYMATPSGCDVKLMTGGCATTSPGAQPVSVTSWFGASLGYAAFDAAWLELGYFNEVSASGAGNIFHSPNAYLYASLTVMLDAIYGRAKRAWSSPPVPAAASTPAR